MDHEIFKTITENHECMALATIINVKGSSPRHPGAKMLLGSKTGSLGTIGGGKGEAYAIQACQKCLEDKCPSLLQVEMLGMDVADPEMICGGIHSVLIEPLEEIEPYRTALAYLSRGERVLLVKRIIAPPDGPIKLEVALLDQNGTPIHGRMNETETLSAARALKSGQPYYDEGNKVYFEPVFPEEKLLILGGGHVGQALAAAAPVLGFHVTVVDDRPEMLTDGKFPGGVRTILADFEQAIAEFPFDSATYVVVVTRGHLFDLKCLRALLKREYRYAGFMGSARKARFIIDQVLQDGFDPIKVDALWAPIGLDIDAETPEELANAILSEMIAVRRNAKILPQLKLAKEDRRTSSSKTAVPVAQCT